MKKTAKALLLGIILAFMACGPVFAAQAEWRDSEYNFGTPKFVLLTDARFAYEGYDTSGRNKFNRFPYAADKIPDMLRAKLQGLPRHRLVNLDYVIKQIKADPAVTEPIDPQAPGFAALLQRELGKHVDLVLYLDVRDYGWFYEWHEAYMKTESYTERISYKRKHSDGTESEGWTDIPRTRVVYVPAGYYVSDCAELALRLYDAKAGKDVWKYSDARNRKSPPISNGYDPSGPESMMKRIFDEAFKRMPLAH
jgi:hypothetical protein